MLKVLTYLKDTEPPLTYSISFLYIPSGVLPGEEKQHQSQKLSATVELCNVLLVVETNTQANKHGKSYVQNKFQNQLKTILKQAINNSVKGGNLTLQTLKSEII